MSRKNNLNRINNNKRRLNIKKSLIHNNYLKILIILNKKFNVKIIDIIPIHNIVANAPFAKMEINIKMITQKEIYL